MVNIMKIEFNEQQLQVLNAAIIELPYRVSAPLIAHINQQIKEQQMLEFDERREKVENHPQV
jgi:16S rRNA A1518/A1519 N6-dimethyltransferase RsmA/KsgA/DIM1 with predicted DNA glycosylase/AP lyase activity